MAVVPVTVAAHPLGMGPGPYPLGGGGGPPPATRKHSCTFGCEPAVGAPMVCWGAPAPAHPDMLEWSSWPSRSGLRARRGEQGVHESPYALQSSDDAVFVVVSSGRATLGALWCESVG